MKSKLLIIFGCISAIFSCASLQRQYFTEDFIDSVDVSDPGEINDLIASLRDSLSINMDPSLHRRLAVYFRLLGTPYSRRISIDEIDKAILHSPDDPMNHVEKGLTLYAMQFNGDALRSFERAARLDPGCFHAWYHLARMKKAEYLKNMCFAAENEEAIALFKKALNLKDRHEDTLFNLGFLHIFRRMYDTAGKYASKAVFLYPDNPRHHLLMGTILFRLRKFAESRAEFNKALELMDERQRRIYEDTSFLLSGEDSESCLALPADARTEWNRRFWFMNDPTPATEINERLLSHFERVFLARELLEHKRLHLDGNETARGMALIKYGYPDRMFYDLGDGLYGAFVIWEYHDEKGGFRLFFQDEFLNGNYHIPIDSFFLHLADATQSVFDNVREVFRYPLEHVNTPFSAQILRLKGGDKNTRIHFAAAFPDSAVPDSRKAYKVAFSIFDSGYNRISDNSLLLRPDTLRTIDRIGHRFYVFEFSVDLLPRSGECSFAVEISGGSPLHRGVWKGSCDIPDFSEEKLMCSDTGLMLHGAAGECGSIPDPLPVYSLSGDICLFSQTYGLRRDIDGLCKYRVSYSIKTPPASDEGLEGLRKVFWWMSRSVRGNAPETPPHVISSFEQRTASTTASNMLRVNLGSVRPGKHIISITVLDLVSGESFSSEREFIVTD